MSSNAKPRCIERVTGTGMYASFHHTQCQKPAMEGGTGYCKVHDPALRKAKRDARFDAYQRKQDLVSDERQARIQAKELVVKAAEAQHALEPHKMSVADCTCDLAKAIRVMYSARLQDPR